MRATFRIYRYDPEKDSRASLDTYTLENSEGITVLEALIRLQQEQDSSLSFRRSCRSAICGSCAVRVNKGAKLACKTQVAHQMEKFGEVLVEPLANLPPVKDLIVDFSGFWERIRKIRPWLAGEADGTWDRENLQGHDDARALEGVASCIMCSCCLSDCTVAEEDGQFLGPAALAKGFRFVSDTRDRANGERLNAVNGEHGVWACAECYNCIQVCPKDVKPMEAILHYRHAALAAGVNNSRGARHVKAFVDDIKSSGRLNEATAPLRIIGPDPAGLLAVAPLGLRMMLKGKIPVLPFLHHSVDNVEEIKQIFDLIEERKR